MFSNVFQDLFHCIDCTAQLRLTMFLNFLQTPVIPIWITCVNGNWGVLFNPNRDLMKSHAAENRWAEQSVMSLDLEKLESDFEIFQVQPVLLQQRRGGQGEARHDTPDRHEDGPDCWYQGNPGQRRLGSTGGKSGRESHSGNQN